MTSLQAACILALSLALAVSARADEPKRLAVLEFEIAQGVKIDRIYFSDLARGAVKKAAPQLFVMTRESTDALLQANGKTLADCTGECEIEIGRKLGADYIVSGRITLMGALQIMTVRLFSTADGALLADEEATGKTVEQLVDAAKEVVGKLAAQLRTVPNIAANPAAASPPAGSPTSIEPKSGLEFVHLPLGNFQLGCERDDQECEQDEQRVDASVVSEFSMGKTPVTVGAYNKCFTANVCSAPMKGGLCNTTSDKLNHPINCVDWNQARTFCAWIGGRLPTAEEWEYAAKSGERRIYPWGDPPPTHQLASYGSQDGTTPVGQYPAGKTKTGLLDMAGNVWQWTASAYDANSKELRGGAWNVQARMLRASCRYRYPRVAQSFDIGFRCAR